jgi:hypothetical protein
MYNILSYIVVEAEREAYAPFVRKLGLFETPLSWRRRPPLWSSGQSSWLHIQRSGFDSQGYQIFWKLVGLERGPLSLVNISEELLWRENSGSDLEGRDYGRRHPSRRPRGTLYSQNLAVTSSTSDGRLVPIVRSWTHATEFTAIDIILKKFRQNINACVDAQIGEATGSN